MRDYVVLCTSDLRNAVNNWKDIFRNSRCQLLFADAFDLTIADLTHMRFDAIIVETRGHSPDEFELIHQLRKQFDQPILLVTASHDVDYHLKAYQAGADECISSQVSKDLLRAKINVWLRWTGQPRTMTQRVAHRDRANIRSHLGSPGG